jgi:HAMP domain-containing protein
MKIRYKTSLIMALLGVCIIVILSWTYNNVGRDIVLNQKLASLKNIADEMALHLDSRLKEKATVAVTLSSSPLIRQALLKSNAAYHSMPEPERVERIEHLNHQWKESDMDDSFVLDRMTSPVAEYLKQQQALFPGEYGEIFLTNRYGVMMATTGKLTTLAHSSKYWWQACYYMGKGRVFLDDRGFDMSVKGYVLGVVIPVRYEGMVIGILKCNVNIMGPLTDCIQDFSLRHLGKMSVARTGGLIIAEHEVTPLSVSVDNVLIPLLANKKGGSIRITGSEPNRLVAYAPIPITVGSEETGFGGSAESIDHIQGNKGEGWDVVVSLDENTAMASARKNMAHIIYFGVFFTLLTVLVTLFLGNQFAKPIVELEKYARALGAGNLDQRIKKHSHDEIGMLTDSLNTMAENLQTTMTSRNQLAAEVERRTLAEEEKAKTILELQKAFDEIKTLHGIIPICMHCKGIRDDEGYWSELEKYISDHSDAMFSHSICDKCLEKYYPDHSK